MERPSSILLLLTFRFLSHLNFRLSSILDFRQPSLYCQSKYLLVCLKDNLNLNHDCLS